jgi:two-component system, sensor histidine kinase
MATDEREIGAADELRTVLDALPEQVVLFRADDLVVTYCNEAKAAAYGLAPRELVGRSLAEILPAAETDELRRHVRSLAGGRRSVTRTMSHEGRTLEWIDQLVTGTDDEPRVLSVGRDVSEHRRLVEERREFDARFQVAMGEAPIGMALVDLEGRILEVNAALCAMVDRSADELVTLTTFDITHPDDVALDYEYGQRLLAGEEDAGTIEKRYLTPDGRVVWGLLKTSVVRGVDGEPAYLLGQVVDITERVAREAELARVADNERAVADRLRELDEMKDAFITAVSHEMRTPLTSLQGFAELLKHRRSDLADDTVADIIDRLHHNARRLSELLGDLLDLEPLTGGQAFVPRLVEADLALVVARAIEQAPIADGRVVTELEPVTVPLDRGKIERIVTSLLSNAVLHTPDGTPIWVRVHSDGAGARLTVADDGPGIAQGLRHAIFDPFVKGGTPAARAGGTGIGLALVARFAELHAGRAWVGDREGGGAEVSVWLPAAASDG